MGREPASGDDDLYARARQRVSLAASLAGVEWLTLAPACVEGRVDPLRLHHVREVMPLAEWVEMTIANEALEDLRKIARKEAKQAGGGDPW